MLRIYHNTRILLPLVCLLTLYGCGTTSPSRDIATPVPHAAEQPKPVKQPAAVAVAPADEPEAVEIEAQQPAAGSVTKPSTQQPGTRILLSSSAAAYREIAEQLHGSFEKPPTVHTLTGVELNDAEVIKAIQMSPETRVVAVGLRAARAARKLDNKRVVFCQVVNYGEHDLVSENMKGVSALPSPHKLFADWKTLSPQLDRVLVVSGDGFEDFMAVAREAAARRGITLVHRVVSNDREFLYAVKRNEVPVQGHWLLADNRVLSVKTLKEVMSYNSKEAIQTVVFQSELLDFGGLFYVMPSSLEVSDKVISRLKASHSELEIGGDDILFLDDHLMGINSQVARQLGLEIPDHLKASVHAE